MDFFEANNCIKKFGSHLIVLCHAYSKNSFLHAYEWKWRPDKSIIIFDSLEARVPRSGLKKRHLTIGCKMESNLEIGEKEGLLEQSHGSNLWAFNLTYKSPRYGVDGEKTSTYMS